MEIAALPMLDPNIELPHEPGEDQQWQESIVLGFADPVKEIGGFIRIGPQPNLKMVRSCFGVCSRNGTNYTRTAQNLPWKPSDTTHDTLSADGFQSATFNGRESRWRASDENVDLDILVADAHGPYDFWKFTNADPAIASATASMHLQAGGTFEGTVRIGGDSPQQISGFTYRDHSWGPRYVNDPNFDMYATWWFVGSLGPDFTFGFGGGRWRSGVHNNFCYIVRDGEIDILNQVDDASVLMAMDGLSVRGGRILVNSPKFGRLVFEAEGYGNVWLEMGDKHFEMSTPCTIRCGDRVGGGLINTILNPRNGNDRPVYIASGKLDNGLYQSRDGLNV